MKRKTTLSLLFLFLSVFMWQTNASGIVDKTNISEMIAPPSNDDCASAIGLTVNTDYLCTNVSAGTLVDATGSTGAPSGCNSAAANADDDVWYKFDAIDTEHKIQLLNVIGTSNIYHIVYDGGASGGNCGTMATIFCGSTTTSDLTGLTIGNTYFIRVFTNAVAGPAVTFDICVGTEASAPANDDCASAVGTTLPHTATYDATNATNNAGSISATGCIDINDGVWYTVVGDGGDISITVNPSSWDAAIGVYEDGCGTLNCVEDSNIGGNNVIETATFSSTNGVTYHINIGRPGVADNPEGVFSLTINSSTLSVDDIIAKGFSYYPNPVKDVLKLRANESITQISLYSVIGREIKRITKSDLDIELDFSNLPTGTYYVRATVGDKSGSFKVIKE